MVDAIGGVKLVITAGMSWTFLGVGLGLDIGAPGNLFLAKIYLGPFFVTVEVDVA